MKIYLNRLCFFVLLNLICLNGCSQDAQAQLQSIMVDGYVLEDFEPEKTDYLFYLPYTYSSTIPEIVVSTATYKEATVELKNIENINGTRKERTASIKVISGSKNDAKTYFITFEILPKLDLFLCIGQSNMAGRGYLKDAENDYKPVDNAFLLTPSGLWEIASNPMNKYSSVRKELKLQQMSLTYTFAKEITEKTGRQMGLIVNARGGSAIESWKKGHADKLYDEAIRRAKEAERWGEFKAILWHQGESNSSRVKEYPEMLAELATNLRNDLGNDNLYFVAGELAYWRGNGKGSSEFNNMIRTISSFINNSD